MLYKALLRTEVFWITYIKWHKFYINNLSVVLGSKQGDTLKNKDWAPIQLLTLSVLTLWFTLPRCQVIFQWKQTLKKLENTLSARKSFRVDFTWRVEAICQFSLRLFQELSRLYILLRLSIFMKRHTGKLNLQRIYIFFLFVCLFCYFSFLFNTTAKQMYWPFLNTTAKTNSLYSLFFFFVTFVFRMGSLLMCLQRAQNG